MENNSAHEYSSRRRRIQELTKLSDYNAYDHGTDRGLLDRSGTVCHRCTPASRGRRARTFRVLRSTVGMAA